MFTNLEAALLLENLSDKAKRFHDLVKKVLMLKPIQLLKFVAAPMEGIMDCGFIVEDTTPKGELAELARGKTHRVVMVRFPTTDSDQLHLFFVIPHRDLSGEEITDQKALSSIQRKIKAIYTDLSKGIPGTDMELDAIFKMRDAAIAKLREIDREVVMAGESPGRLIQKDPVRGLLGSLITRFYPDRAQQYIAALASLDRGTIEKNIQRFSWNGSNIPEFTRMAAVAVADRDPDDPQTVKAIAGLALATMATQLLDAEAA